MEAAHASDPCRRARRHPQDLWRHHCSRRRNLHHRRGQRSRATRRERRWQVDGRQAPRPALSVPPRARSAFTGGPHPGLSPRAAHALGLQTAFQEMTLVRDLTVLDNMLLPYAPQGLTGLIRRGAARAAGYAPPRRPRLLRRPRRRDLRSRTLRPPEDRDRPRPLASAEGPSPRRAHLHAGGARRRLARRCHRRREGSRHHIVFITHRMREVRAFCDSADHPAQRPPHPVRPGRRHLATPR